MLALFDAIAADPIRVLFAPLSFLKQGSKQSVNGLNLSVSIILKRGLSAATHTVRQSFCVRKNLKNAQPKPKGGFKV